MNWVLLDSSAIYAAAYAGSALYLIFQGRDVAYEYPNVPVSVFADLIGAESPGTFYNQEIRPTYGLRRKPTTRKRP